MATKRNTQRVMGIWIVLTIAAMLAVTLAWQTAPAFAGFTPPADTAVPPEDTAVPPEDTPVPPEGTPVPPASSPPEFPESPQMPVTGGQTSWLGDNGSLIAGLTGAMLLLLLAFILAVRHLARSKAE